eukprot:4038-Hanusia_phi.AAC.3
MERSCSEQDSTIVVHTHCHGGISKSTRGRCQMRGLKQSAPLYSDTIRDSKVKGYGVLNSKFRSTFEHDIVNETSHGNGGYSEQNMSTTNRNVLVVKGRTHRSSEDQYCSP